MQDYYPNLKDNMQAMSFYKSYGKVSYFYGVHSDLLHKHTYNIINEDGTPI